MLLNPRFSLNSLTPVFYTSFSRTTIAGNTKIKISHWPEHVLSLLAKNRREEIRVRPFLAIQISKKWRAIANFSNSNSMPAGLCAGLRDLANIRAAGR